MPFRHYLEDEDDKPYYTQNSLAFYYEDMERKQKLIESLAKNIAGYDIRLTENLEAIEQQVDNRLADWDKQLDKFPDSVEELLSKWSTDGTIDTVIQTALIDEKLKPVTAQLAEEVKQKNGYKDDPNNKPYRGIGFHFINGYNEPELTRLKGLAKTFSDMGFNSICLYIDHFVTDTEVDSRIYYVNELMSEIVKHNYEHVMFRCSGNFASYSDKAVYFSDMSRVLLRYLNGINYTFDSVAIGTEDINATKEFGLEWKGVIDDIRTLHDGLIVSVSYINQLETLSFADYVDHLGFDVYPAITYNPEINKMSSQELEEKFWVRGDLEKVYNYCVSSNKKAFIIESGVTPFKLAYTGPGTWQTGMEYGVDGDTQLKYWQSALTIFDNAYWLKGYMMFDGTSGYSPISPDSPPELKTYIEDLFKRGVENGKV